MISIPTFSSIRLTCKILSDFDIFRYPGNNLDKQKKNLVKLMEKAGLQTFKGQRLLWLKTIIRNTIAL